MKHIVKKAGEEKPGFKQKTILTVYIKDNIKCSTRYHIVSLYEIIETITELCTPKKIKALREFRRKRPQKTYKIKQTQELQVGLKVKYG